jgi:hypothetical protein
LEAAAIVSPRTRISSLKLGRVRVFDTNSQVKALKLLVELAQSSAIEERFRTAALQIVAPPVCDSRDDRCELEAIYEAVKFGTDRVAGMENGLKYVSDPRWADYFTKATKILKMLQLKNPANGEDCDGHAVFLMALCSAIGFRVGARAWGPDEDQDGEYEHVYCVVLVPKGAREDTAKVRIIGMDTTVDEAYVGWQPDYGHVLTVWAE